MAGGGPGRGSVNSSTGRPFPHYMGEQGGTTGGNVRADRDLVEATVRTGPVVITVVDGDGRVTFPNERAAEIYGRSRGALDDFVHDDSRWDLVDEDGESLAAGEAPFDRVVHGEETIYDQVVCLRRPSGERVWVSVTGAPQWNDDAEPQRSVFAFEDVTEREERERKLREKERRSRPSSRIRTSSSGCWNRTGRSWTPARRRWSTSTSNSRR